MNNAHIISIGSLASFSRGLTYSGSDEVDYSSNVVLRSNNIDLATNTLNFDELKYISDAINIPEDKKLQRNSIFMCMSNGSKQHLGKVAFIDRDYPYAFGGFMGLIKPKEDIIIPKLLYNVSIVYPPINSEVNVPINFLPFIIQTPTQLL